MVKQAVSLQLLTINSKLSESPSVHSVVHTRLTECRDTKLISAIRQTPSKTANNLTQR